MHSLSGPFVFTLLSNHCGPLSDPFAEKSVTLLRSAETSCRGACCI